MAAKSYEKSFEKHKEKEHVVLPVRAKEVKELPDFFVYMEEEFAGDYSAARSSYIKEFGVDPTMMALR